ncbi:AzlD domain-containing protein [Devosia sp.]|uniref:AzlD domain-containing protein n=1 Tax=Devosia sp. TaxID=1871048 RepID=UPI0035AE78C4
MSAESLLAILGMAAVTYAIRAGGYLLATRLPESGFIASWMKHLPGAVLAALVANAIIAGGAAEALAAAAVAALYLVTRNLFAAMAGGVLAVYLARLALGG